MSELPLESERDSFALYAQQSEVGASIYAAGYPSYPANFSRDTLEAGILSGSARLLISQLEMSARHQGLKNDPLTGEQPGKIHHEIPGAQLPGRGDGFTTYNACDSTPLFLIGAEGLLIVDEPAFDHFLDTRRSNLERAVDHLLALTGEDDNLYWDKTPLGGTGYTLRVTYWKDSILPHANGKQEPTYPVTFSQAHFIAARGLLSASRILQEPLLARKADAMFRAGIAHFIGAEAFTVYTDADGELSQASSDELHSLAYIPAIYADTLPLDAIADRAATLTTPYGFMCTPQQIAQQLPDRYHGDKVWVFEQAYIHYGATKFVLAQEAATAARIREHIREGQELFGLQWYSNGKARPVPEGNERQLWSVAAAEYFAGGSILSRTAWL